MASTLSQKWLTIFCQKAQNLVYSVLCDFVQVSLECGSNTYQIMYGRLKTSNVSVSNDNLKYPIGKPIFAVNLPFELFRATVTNANPESL